MRITTLVENQAILPVLGAEHGLSLMIETGRKTILFDMGKSDLFLRNAEALGCSIASVDLAIVSHGHYDHGGGIGTFLSANDHAPVYIRSSAFQQHRSNRPNGELADIGLNPALLESGRLVFTGEQEVLDEELSLFSRVVERAHFSDGNASILMLKDGKIVPDDFVHEQNLILRQGNTNVLIAGCAHSGIVNILNRAKNILGRMPDVVIGGFHLQNPTTKQSEPEARIRAIGEILRDSGAMFYTGHCTGDEPFEQLKEMLGQRIATLHAGSIIEI